MTGGEGTAGAQQSPRAGPIDGLVLQVAERAHQDGATQERPLGPLACQIGLLGPEPSVGPISTPGAVLQPWGTHAVALNAYKQGERGGEEDRGIKRERVYGGAPSKQAMLSVGCAHSGIASSACRQVPNVRRCLTPMQHIAKSLAFFSIPQSLR
jgi:hypothetical protein